MKRNRMAAIGLSALCVILTSLDPALSFERTEVREDCDEKNPLRQPFFGDLHVHTRYSFDSYISSQRNDPWDAYRYAKGHPITLPNADAEQTVVVQIERPLDFAVVTDHGEFLGEMNLCTGEGGSWARWSPLCLLTRSNIIYLQFLAADMWQKSGVSDPSQQKKRPSVCRYPGADCPASLAEFWGRIQQAAEDHYDRTSKCGFTTFVGYEYTDAPYFKNLHRNVIFRNDAVLVTPITSYETGTRNVPALWEGLRRDCIDGDARCDVLAIPHNSNLSGGWMFPDPEDPDEARDRDFFEPLVELVQHKASSECRFDRVLGRGLDTQDELCTFEQNRTDSLASLGVVFGEMRAPEGRPVSLDEFGRRNMVRNVLKDGLVLQQRLGTNPFRLGFIGSTDTHSATPGATAEDSYRGHLGRRDAGYRNVQDHFEDNPGGLAVVWAEENSRDSIFEAMRRRETYATSGTRPVVRFFGGFGIEAAACSRKDRIAHGYAAGVPMGGELSERTEGEPLRFMVLAAKDPGTLQQSGVDLQRIQIIKGWVDSKGGTHEEVFDVVGGSPDSVGVNPDTCEPFGSGHKELCTVWEDPRFDADQSAFYYARVLENPSCRWSTLQCQAAGVNPFSQDCVAEAEAADDQAREGSAIGSVYRRCCWDEEEQPFYSPVIQERAWTSPIWYEPANPSSVEAAAH